MMNDKEGFTMIELSLSLIFISVISLAVVMVIMNSVSAYHRSIVLNRVDQVGANLVDDMRSSIMASEPWIENMCEDKACVTGRKYLEYIIVESGSGSVKLKNGKEVYNGPLSGALCTGTNSYVWNSGYFYNTDEYESPEGLKATVAGADVDFRLLKIVDWDREVCRNRSGNKYSLPEDGESEELLEKESGLALYDLTTSIAEQTDVRRSAYYYTSFILGTVQGGVSVNAQNCTAPAADENESGTANFDYCAINKFNFAALATGRKNG